MPTPACWPAVRRIAAAAALGSVILLGSGCGSHDTMPGMSSSSAPPTGTSTDGTSRAFNDADVAFAQQMIPHHEQAVAMSDVIVSKTGVDPEVTALATRIKDAQAPEIVTMTGWLSTWGQPSGGGMSGMDPAGDGMMSAADLDALAAADGPTGQRLYLDGMVAHHEGAVAMATTEIGAGQSPDAVELARTVAAAQQEEIATMKKILDRI